MLALAPAGSAVLEFVPGEEPVIAIQETLADADFTGQVELESVYLIGEFGVSGTRIEKLAAGGTGAATTGESIRFGSRFAIATERGTTRRDTDLAAGPDWWRRRTDGTVF